MEHMSKFKFADSVSMRLVQIFQEAMMMGVDGADLLRQVRLIPDETDPQVLVLSPDYQAQVKEAFAKYEAQMKELQVPHDSKLVLGGGNN